MFFWLAVITLAVGQKRKVVLNTPLDKQHPVELTSTSAFTFENRIFTLDSRHILLDATVTDSAVLASPFIFNNGAMAVPAIVYALMMNVVLLTYVGILRKQKSRNEQ